MTNNVDINVYSKNFYPRPLGKPLSCSKGEDVNPYEYPVLEDYVPQDNQMQEELEEEFEESERDSFGEIEVPNKDALDKED